MNLINESQIRAEWAPIIESATGITNPEKLNWMSKMCHVHKLYEDANIASLGSFGSYDGMTLHGAGAVAFPAVGNANVGGTGAVGSGDKAPSLLPLAMQVAAMTIGLDLVPVIPMTGPMGMLSYLDAVYEGGRVDNNVTPTYIKAKLDKEGTAIKPGSIKITVNARDSFADVFADAAWTSEANIAKETDPQNLWAHDTIVGVSLIDGKFIIQLGTDTITAVKTDKKLVADFYKDAELVKALEDHIPNFAGNPLNGDPFAREIGERTPEKVMGLQLFSKSVEAKTFQVAAAVTREQIQDLKQFGVDAVSQVESVLINELTQRISDYIINSIVTLGRKNVDMAITAGQLPGTGLNLALNNSGMFTGGTTEATEHRKIMTQILAAANFIAHRSKRGAGNFAVVGPQISTALQSVAGFVPNPMANTISQVAGSIYPVGSIAGVQIYTNPNWAWGESRVVVGKKGDGNQPGLVFMPYLMAESVSTIAEGTMAPKIACKSRFALVEAGFHPEAAYATFTVTIKNGGRDYVSLNAAGNLTGNAAVDSAAGAVFAAPGSAASPTAGQQG